MDDFEEGVDYLIDLDGSVNTDVRSNGALEATTSG